LSGTASVWVQSVSVAELPTLTGAAFRDQLAERLQSDWRLLSMFGRRDAQEVTVTALFSTPQGKLEVARSVIPVESGYHELTSRFPALHCFEREIHEQTALPIHGHPWLKPIRHEDEKGARMADYPYYVVRGKEVHEVAVGPIHAGVIEPGSFRFSCFGEQVHHLEIQLGYQHRGVERQLRQGDPKRLGPLVETIAGDTSIGHAWAYCAALECLAGAEQSLSVEFGRALMLELERVGMHLAALSGLAADIGFLQGASTYGRLRTTAINTTMKLCGSRFGRGALRPGGVRLRWSPELSKETRASIQLLRDDLQPIDELFQSSRVVQHRLRGAGVLSARHAAELGVVGLAARASNIAIDTRYPPRGGAYQFLPIRPVRYPDGDSWSRAAVRIDELDASLRFIAAVLDRYAEFNEPPEPLGELPPNRLAISVVEAFRGEIIHCLETDEAGAVRHYKVQDPSLRNWMGLALAVRDNEISDFPICNKSFDLSYCGNDL